MIKKDKKCTTMYFMLFFFIMIVMRNASADEIVLENGDRLTGTVRMVGDGTVVFETGYSEPIKLQKSKITHISTDNPQEVLMISGEILKGKLTTGEDGRLMVESGDGREAAVVDWDRVTALNPPPVEPPKWKGSITLGAGLQSGNSDRAHASIGAEAKRRSEQDRFSLRFLYNYAEENDRVTSRNTFGALKYDYFFTKAFYGYVGVEVLNDKFKDLNLRTVVGPGVGYQIWDDTIKFLLLEAGLAYFSEDLKQGEDKQWLTARLAGDFSYTLKETIVFSDQIVIYPNLEETGQYKLRNEAAITSALGSGWALRFANILERDSDPPLGVKQHDLYWTLGLQYGF
jgi:putative salt-induced outer membrane protein YdiY